MIYQKSHIGVQWKSSGLSFNYVGIGKEKGKNLTPTNELAIPLTKATMLSIYRKYQ